MKYNVFASKYDTVEKMKSFKQRDEALEFKNNSDVYLISANSLECAIDQYVETLEFNQFAAKINSTVYVYYLDENGVPCHM